MFVEGDVEVRVKDRAAIGLDDHEMKLWLRSAFRNGICYRISNFHYDTSARTVRAVVALGVGALPENERRLLVSRPNDVGLLRSFMEKMFAGKGVCRCIGEPQLREM